MDSGAGCGDGANFRMQEYERQVRTADRLRRRELYYGAQAAQVTDSSRRG